MDEDTARFYRTKAKEHGVSVSEYLRQTLVHGVIAENVQEIEQRLRNVVDEIRHSRGQGDVSTPLPEELLLSVFTSEAMQKAVVEARDIQKFYEAQDSAKAKLQKIREA